MGGTPTHPLASTGVALARCALFALACFFAYDIRLYAVTEYGRIIHEFDPWFNFRATQYLADNGWVRFSKWFDYMSWYPLGRPVGTTIYPGMQVTAVTIWKTLGLIGDSVAMSLNDVCVFFPAWFGAVATLLTGLLTAECSGDKNAAVVASLVMSIVPAHTMRSVAGGYDNESLAVTAMVLTFFVWCRALRTPRSWPIGAAAGLAYVYMVAAWGGYTFVLNMVGLHAAILVPFGKVRVPFPKSNGHRLRTLGDCLRVLLPVTTVTTTHGTRALFGPITLSALLGPITRTPIPRTVHL